MRRSVITGGGDGCINVWQLDAQGGLGARTACTPLALPEQTLPRAPPMVRALDCCTTGAPKRNVFIVGTAACDMWAFDEGSKADMLLFGHSGTLRSVATNPRREFSHIFATVSDACRVAIWSALSRQVCSAVDLVMRVLAR